MRLGAELLAKAGIFIQFMALVRTLAEYFRLRAAGAVELEPYVAGGLIAAICTWVSVVCFFLRWHRAAVTVSAATVAILFAYKMYAVR